MGPDIHIQTPQERLRVGIFSLAVGVIVLAVAVTLSLLTGTWLWVLYTSPVFVLGLTLALILLTTPPNTRAS